MKSWKSGGPGKTVNYCKQSIYIPEDMLEEIRKEAIRQDRSLSWLVQHAWKVAKKDIEKLPALEDL